MSRGVCKLGARQVGRRRGVQPLFSVRNADAIQTKRLRVRTCGAAWPRSRNYGTFVTRRGGGRGRRKYFASWHLWQPRSHPGATRVFLLHFQLLRFCERWKKRELSDWQRRAGGVERDNGKMAGLGTDRARQIVDQSKASYGGVSENAPRQADCVKLSAKLRRFDKPPSTWRITRAVHAAAFEPLPDRGRGSSSKMFG